MMLNEITAQAGRRHRRKRVGRGESSGLGKTCGRGTKGCQSRAGGGVRPLPEGGQMPIFRRLPKRGFSNFNFRTEYAVVNLSDLVKYFDAGATVDPAALHKVGLIGSAAALVKVLGKGQLDRRLAVTAHAFSKAALAAIEQAGGTTTVLPQRDAAALWKAKRLSAKRNRPGAAGAARGKTPTGEQS